MAEETTTIQITKADWKRLNARKEPGEGFHHVTTRVLDKLEAAEADGFVPDDEEGPRVDPDEFDTFDKIEARSKQEAYREGVTDGRERIRALVEEMDLPGDGTALEARRESLVDLYDHLRMHGQADKSEFVKVLEAHDHGYASAESFWSNIVKGKDTLQSLPGVEPPSEGMSTWRFDG